MPTDGSDFIPDDPDFAADDTDFIPDKQPSLKAFSKKALEIGKKANIPIPILGKTVGKGIELAQKSLPGRTSEKIIRTIASRFVPENIPFREHVQTTIEGAPLTPEQFIRQQGEEGLRSLTTPFGILTSPLLFTGLAARSPQKAIQVSNVIKAARPINQAEKIAMIADYKETKKLLSSLKEGKLKLSKQESKAMELELLERKRFIEITMSPRIQGEVLASPVVENNKAVEMMIAKGDIQEQPGYLKNIYHSFRRGLGVPSTLVNSMGEHGQKLIRGLKSAQVAYESRAGGSVAGLRNKLQKLNSMEMENLVDVLDKGFEPISPIVNDAAEFIRGINSLIAKEAVNLGFSIKTKSGNIVKWVPRENYFPHMYSETLLNNPKYKEVALQKLMKENGLSRTKAEAMLQSQIRRRLQPRYGALERARVTDLPGWIREPEFVLAKYWEAAFKRLELAKKFGKDGVRGDALIAKMTDTSDRELADVVFKSMFQPEVKTGSEKILSKAANLVNDLTTMAFMGTSAISNSTQGVFGSAIRTGFFKTIKDLGIVVSDLKKSKQAAIQSGAYLDSVASEVMKKMGGTRRSQEFLRRMGFLKVEEFNRILANQAGKSYAGSLIKKINALKNSTSPNVREAAFIKREMDRFGINLKRVIQRGHFKDKEVNLIGKAVSDLTQGRATPLDMPLFTNDPVGKIAMQFMTFGINWGKFVNQFVIAEAKKGNFTPMARLLAVGALGGEIPAGLMSIVTGKERPKKLPERLIKNLAYVGGIGIVYDVASSLFHGTFGQPPVARLGVELARALKSKDKGKKLTGFALKRILPVAVGATPAAPLIIPGRMIGERLSRGDR